MKTRFTKEMLYKSGQYLFLQDGKGRWPEGTFLARFKHGGPFTMAKFKKELIDNHYVEEYLEALMNKDFNKRKAPLEILRDKNPGWYKGIVDDFKNKNS